MPARLHRRSTYVAQAVRPSVANVSTNTEFQNAARHARETGGCVVAVMPWHWRWGFAFAMTGWLLLDVRRSPGLYRSVRCRRRGLSNRSRVGQPTLTSKSGALRANSYMPHGLSLGPPSISLRNAAASSSTPVSILPCSAFVHLIYRRFANNLRLPRRTETSFGQPWIGVCYDIHGCLACWSLAIRITLRVEGTPAHQRHLDSGRNH